jgi:hypothetical protein
VVSDGNDFDKLSGDSYGGTQEINDDNTPKDWVSDLSLRMSVDTSGQAQAAVAALLGRVLQESGQEDTVPIVFPDGQPVTRENLLQLLQSQYPEVGPLMQEYGL